MAAHDKQVNLTMNDRPPAEPDDTDGETQAQIQPEDTPVEYAEEYPAYCGLLQDIPASGRYDLRDDKLRHMPPGDKDSGWQNCLNSVEKYDRELCQAYREQIDTLLVFAGLFSAVVTAFAVESYQWLLDDPMDTSVELLRDVVGLLSQNLNLTAPPTPSTAQRLSGGAVIRINSFWFLSLSLSLSAALVGILCKQWLREFEHNVGQSPEAALAVRHIRFQGFEYWKVGSIVTSVPILMQLALAFFIIGIVELLWRLHTIVACCVTVTAGLTLAFYLATTLLPVMQYAYICIRCCVKPLRTRDYPIRKAFTEPQCAFKSSQAWLAFRIAQPVMNHLLKAYGYEFSPRRPPAFFERILRPTDSWVDFDLNWIKCRRDLHDGPGSAFESLTWVAGNLGEMHMNSWLWHCVWARWLRSRDSPHGLAFATSEIESVARSYPRIVGLGNNNPPLARSQAQIFRCSLRTDLPINTALELLLRVTAVSGASSQWTQEALYATRLVYHGLSIRLSDDIAIALFRIAERQSYTIILGRDGPNAATPLNAALGFKEVGVILQRGSHLRDVFMPAMSGLVVQWLRSNPPETVADMAPSVLEDMIWHLISQGYSGPGLQDLRRCRGIMFFAKLAHAVSERWPTPTAFESRPEARAVFLRLLAIFSEGFPELSQGRSGGSTDPSPRPFGNTAGEGSNPPVPDARADTHASEEAPEPEPPGPLDHAGEESQPPPQEHLCIDVHIEAESEAEKSANCSASRVTSPVAAASSPNGAMSPGPLGMSAAEQQFKP